MYHEVRTTDWKVRGIGGLDIADGLAGGVSLFEFANLDSMWVHSFAFVGAGLGLSAKTKNKLRKGMKGLPFNLDDGSWDDLEGIRMFNGSDLNWSLGQAFAGGAALVIGFQAMYISGGMSVLDSPYFRLVPCHGYIMGLGAGTSILTGMWIHLGEERL